jgi:hypothetical protein
LAGELAEGACGATRAGRVSVVVMPGTPVRSG